MKRSPCTTSSRPPGPNPGEEGVIRKSDELSRRASAVLAAEAGKLTRTSIECIDACNDCAVALRAIAETCRDDTDPLVHRAITHGLDCAEICSLTASLLARESELAWYLCRLTATVCWQYAMLARSMYSPCFRDSIDHAMFCASRCEEQSKSHRALLISWADRAKAAARASDGLLHHIPKREDV